MKQLVSKKNKFVGNVTNRMLSVLYHTNKNSIPIEIDKFKNIVIVDFPMIGDLVMGIPFYKTLKKNCPNAHITLVCQKWAGDIMREQKVIDEIVEMDGKSILHDPIKLIKNYVLFKKAINEVNQRTYDIAIEPRGDIRNIFFMRHIHSKEYVSFNYSGGECMLSRVLIPDENILHILDDKLNVLEQLGMIIEEKDRIPNLIIPQKLQNNAKTYLDNLGIKDTDCIIAINPGASLKIKKWKKFPAFIERIKDKTDDNVIILAFGVEADREILNEIVEMAHLKGMRAYAIVENLLLYIALVSKCNFMLCNDSSAGHLAAAFNIPVLVIFGPTMPEFGAPRSNNTVAVVSKYFKCKPCFMSTCPYKNECIEDISLDDVDHAFEKLLRQN